MRRRNSAKPTQLTDLRIEYGVNQLLVIPIDVTDSNEITDGLAEIKGKFRRLGVIVNIRAAKLFRDVNLIHSIMEDVLNTQYFILQRICGPTPYSILLDRKV